MTLRVRIRFWRLFRNFFVTDEAGEPYCTVEQQLCFPEKLFLYDGDGKVFASLRRLWRIPKTFRLSWEGHEVMMRRRLFSRRYTLRALGWHTKRNLLDSDHCILKGTDETIARIEAVYNGCNVHCSNPVDALPALLFALAVQKKQGTFGTTEQ